MVPIAASTLPDVISKLCYVCSKEDIDVDIKQFVRLLPMICKDGDCFRSIMTSGSLKFIILLICECADEHLTSNVLNTISLLLDIYSNRQIIDYIENEVLFTCRNNPSK